MKYLLDYNRFRLEAMQDKICKLEFYINQLETYCFELSDENCPTDYKSLIKQEIYNLKTK